MGQTSKLHSFNQLLRNKDFFFSVCACAGVCVRHIHMELISFCLTVHPYFSLFDWQTEFQELWQHQMCFLPIIPKKI